MKKISNKKIIFIFFKNFILFKDPYIYIYTYMMAVLSVLNVTTSFVSCPLPSPLLLPCIYIYIHTDAHIIN